MPLAKGVKDRHHFGRLGVFQLHNARDHRAQVREVRDIVGIDAPGNFVGFRGGHDGDKFFTDVDDGNLVERQGGFDGVDDFQLGQRRGLLQNDLRLRQRGGAQQVASDIFGINLQNLIQRRRRQVDAAGGIKILSGSVIAPAGGR